MLDSGEGITFSFPRGKLSSDLERDFLEMGRAAFSESTFSDLVSYDEGKMLNVARTYSVSDDKVLIVARDGDGATIGVFAGYSLPFYFSDDKIARDVLWYVVPEHRASGVGIRLLVLFERWARDRGSKAVWIGQDSGIDTSKFSRVLESRGYGFIGSNYSLRVG